MIFQFGNITNPFGLLSNNPSLQNSTQGEGLFAILSMLVKFSIVIAGLFTFWNLIAAGYMFMSSGGDQKAITKAWEKIWLSVVGLLIVAGSFILAGIFGWLIFEDVGALINFRIFTI